jgi:hypothetical protein
LGLAKLKPVTGNKQHILDGTTIYQGAIGTSQITQPVTFQTASQFGMAARNLGIRQANFSQRVPAN